jgi:hypothetical protein
MPSPIVPLSIVLFSIFAGFGMFEAEEAELKALMHRPTDPSTR